MRTPLLKSVYEQLPLFSRPQFDLEYTERSNLYMRYSPTGRVCPQRPSINVDIFDKPPPPTIGYAWFVKGCVAWWLLPGRESTEPLFVKCAAADLVVLLPYPIGRTTATHRIYKCQLNVSVRHSLNFWVAAARLIGFQSIWGGVGR